MAFWFGRTRMTGATLSLCLAAATHSFLLFSFFPYAGYMALTLLEDHHNHDEDTTSVTVNTVGLYAGILGGAFALGRFLGFLPWKVVRNRWGDRQALMCSLAGTGLASLWVGVATSLPEAVLARLVQGLLNCVSGSVKRAAINARKQQQHQNETGVNGTGGDAHDSDNNNPSPEEVYDSNPEAFVLSVMWWGTALGPIVGGLLSDPGFLGACFGVMPETTAWYAAHPYLLSNGAGAFLCWLSLAAVAIFTSELPPEGNDGAADGETTPLLASPRTSATGNSLSERAPRVWKSFVTLWRTNREARYHLLAYWSFSFVVVCCDEAFPLFLITSRDSTGLGLSEAKVGLLLSSARVLVALWPALDRIFEIENGAKEGIYRVLSVCAVLGTVPLALVPLGLVWNDSGADSETLLGLTPVTFGYLVMLAALVNGSIGLYFSLIGMVTSRTLRVVQKDEAARIMTMGALLVRSFAPVVSGSILSRTMGVSSLSPREASWMVWIVIGLVFGLVAAGATVFLARLSGSGVLTDKQRRYLVQRMGSLTSLTDGASKSVWARWKDLFSFRLHVTTQEATSDGRRRRSSIVATPVGDVEEIQEDTHHVATWKEHTVAPGVDFEKVSFFIIGTHKKDKACVPHVLVPPLMDALQKHLPTRCAESNFWLKYSLLRDGASAHSLEAKSGLARDTIMAIETLDGDVFGCFVTKPWIPTNNHYRRSSDSFLWRLKKQRSAGGGNVERPEADAEGGGDENYDAEIYPYTGNNDLCQLFADDKIAIGGGVLGTQSDGFGILLERDLLSGSSSPCETYENPCLCAGSSDENRFEVANMEVWCLTPFMFVADAERSEKHLQFVRDNSYDTRSDGECPCSTCQWSHYL